MAVTNRWLPIPCTPVLPVASIAHASARMAAASSSPSPSLLEGEDRVNVAGGPSDDDLPAALPSFVASPPRLVLLWVPGALGRGVDCAGPPASSKFSFSLFDILVCLLCAQPIEKKFYRCIVCKRKALVNLMAMRNRFVRELYEHVYRAKDFSTMERGNRGTEQRAMEQKVLNPSTTLPSDLRGSMSPCPCLGLDYRCRISRS
jgi:hypothetical protein